MSKNITLLGASYSDVPAVRLPKTGGGTADFTDVSDTTAQAGDVSIGKYFYNSSGVRTQGTNSGGGGGIATLLGTYSLGSISTSSTKAATTGKTQTVSGINDYQMLIVVVKTASVTNSRHYMTVSNIYLNGSSAYNTISGATIATAKQNWKASSAGTLSTRTSTTAYGIYPYSATVSSGSVSILYYQYYNSTNTGTINGSYTAYVYGVNLN